MPGTTSPAGRTSMSTGSAAHSRSSASALARSRGLTGTDTVSGERLVIALLQELKLLPLAVHGRPEMLGVLGRPDLRADDKVVRIELERGAPHGERLVRT